MTIHRQINLSLGVEELQSKVIPMLVIRGNHRLDGHRRKTGPAIARVDDAVLTSANLATHGGHTWHKDRGP